MRMTYGRALLPESWRIESFWSGMPKMTSALITYPGSRIE